VRGALARWAADLAAADAGLRAVTADSMHLTLCFLGNRPVSEIDAIGGACAQAASPPLFELVTGALLGFPSQRPRVLAVAIEDRSRDLHRLQARLAAALSELGSYQPERRPFVPHVTLARARGSGTRPARPGEPARPLSFTASTVTLLRSTPSPAGSVYEPLRSVFLDVAS
jgi:2'-5' RNA ligase